MGTVLQSAVVLHPSDIQDALKGYLYEAVQYLYLAVAVHSSPLLGELPAAAGTTAPVARGLELGDSNN